MCVAPRVFSTVCTRAPTLSCVSLLCEVDGVYKVFVCDVSTSSCGATTVCGGVSSGATAGGGPRPCFRGRQRGQGPYWGSPGSWRRSCRRRASKTSRQTVKMTNRIATTTASSMAAPNAVVPLAFDARGIVSGSAPAHGRCFLWRTHAGQ